MAGNDYNRAIGPSYRLDDVNALVESSINCFPRKLPDGKWNLVGISGEVQIVDLADENRGSRNVDGRWFAVSGSTLYELTAAGVATNRGTLSTTSGYVSMSNNATQLVMVDGTNLYIYTLATNTFTSIVSAGWRGSDNVDELDGYFIFVDPDTQDFYISEIDDGSVLDALDFSNADSSPDNLVAHIVSHRQLLLFGTKTCEIWINSGAQGFPFVRYNSYTLEVGCVGPHALIKAADTVFWVGQTERGTGIVYNLVGNQPTRVSTIAVEEKLNQSTDLSSATMWCYQIKGHEFVGINAPGLETTWVYDAAQKEWHERGEWDAGWLPIRSRLVTFFEGDHYAFEPTGAVVRLDDTVYTLNSRVLVRERTWPAMTQPSMEPISFRSVEVAMMTGVVGSGDVTLEISNDGGQTFGSPLLRSLGAIGRWMQRIRWNNLGLSLNRVFRIRLSDPHPFVLYNASVDV